MIRDKKVVIAGIGKSGKAAAALLENEGAQLYFYDGNRKADTTNIKASVWLDEYPEEIVETMDFAVFSPGVPLDIPFADFLKSKNIPIIGEIELAYMMEQGTIVGITGTNGKTTTTTLVGEIAKAYFKQVFVVGNIGIPYTEQVEKTTKDSVTVAEISSFQLETIQDFHPAVSAILNITPDHLNRHKTFENYAAAKCDITKNQTPEDVCVLNYEDEWLCKAAKSMNCKVAYFSSKTKLDNGVYLAPNGDMIYADTEEVICNVSECRLLGIHNYENYMAAALISLSLGIPMQVIRETIINFAGVEHRVEFVREYKGVRYYNDSKGTNTDAAIKGIQSMNRKTVLIGGGFDKKADFTDWIQSFDGKVSYLILLGETKEQIEETAVRCGFDRIIKVDTLEMAVEKAVALAKEGEAVLLSPACASWDMFDSYEQRGDFFKQYVNSLE